MQYPIIDLITDAYINNGWTGLDVSTGKNLLNPNEMIKYSNGNGRRWFFDNGIMLESGQSYTFSVSGTEQSIRLYFVDKDKATTLISNTRKVTYTPNENIFVFLQAFRSSEIEDENNFQLELGTIATNYEPYNPNPSNDFTNRLKLPLPHYFPHPVIDALQRAAAGTQTADDTEILQHYLTPLGIGGI